MQTLERSNVEKTELLITKNILTTYQQHCLNIYQRSNGDNLLTDSNPHNKSRVAGHLLENIINHDVHVKARS